MRLNKNGFNPMGSCGGPTHLMFEELVICAESDPAEDLLLFTGKIMNNCMLCHAKYKVD